MVRVNSSQTLLSQTVLMPWMSLSSYDSAGLKRLGFDSFVEASSVVSLPGT